MRVSFPKSCSGCWGVTGFGVTEKSDSDRVKRETNVKKGKQVLFISSETEWASELVSGGPDCLLWGFFYGVFGIAKESSIDILWAWALDLIGGLETWVVLSHFSSGKFLSSGVCLALRYLCPLKVTPSPCSSSQLAVWVVSGSIWLTFWVLGRPHPLFILLITVFLPNKNTFL